MLYNFLINKISRKSPDLDNLFQESNYNNFTVTFCNPLSFKFLKKNKDYAQYLKSIDFIYADGMLLCKLIEAVRGEACERVSFDGNSIAPKVFELCRKYNQRVALVGSTEENITVAADKLKKEINIVYYRNGFFSNDAAIDSFLEELQLQHINCIIFGMGAPLQEKMLYLLKQKKINILAFTCGGYLEQIAKRGLSYYPEFYNQYNLRWAYRVFKEPVKLLSRYIFDYSPFYAEYAKVLFPKHRKK